jgi:hypothetical protein
MLKSSLYLTDLNPNVDSGLNHQLWGIVNALMLGEYTSRNVMITGFYPHYNIPKTINLYYLINIDETNKKLKEIGLNTSIIPYDSQIPWTRTAYPNPVFNKFKDIPGVKRFHDMIEALRGEDHIRYVDIWTVFVWPLMYPYDNDPYLSNKAIKIFTCLIPSPMIKIEVLKELHNIYPMKKSENIYFAMHLRLEDDWVDHLTKKYNHPDNIYFGYTEEKFIETIYSEITTLIDNNFCGEGNEDIKIYLATGLHLTENRNRNILARLEERYPERFVYHTSSKIEWDKVFEHIDTCRELEGYIDLHICLGAQKIICSKLSSFSSSIKYVFDYKGKECYQYSS